MAQFGSSIQSILQFIVLSLRSQLGEGKTSGPSIEFDETVDYLWSILKVTLACSPIIGIGLVLVLVREDEETEKEKSNSNVRSCKS
jgi:hypothetical protein